MTTTFRPKHRKAHTFKPVSFNQALSAFFYNHRGQRNQIFAKANFNEWIVLFEIRLCNAVGKHESCRKPVPLKSVIP